MKVKALFMRNGDVRVVDSYDTSNRTDEIFQYWCLPLGLQCKTEMDIEGQSFEKIQRFDPRIAFEYKSAHLFAVVEEIKNWSTVDNHSVIESSITHHFLLSDYIVNSNIVEHIIEVIHGRPVWVGIEEVDDADMYIITFKDGNNV